MGHLHYRSVRAGKIDLSLFGWSGQSQARAGSLLMGRTSRPKGLATTAKHHVSSFSELYWLIIWRHWKITGSSTNKLGKDILLLGLDETQIKRNVLQLSGGQQQRVAIARALVGDLSSWRMKPDEQTAGDIIAILKKGQGTPKCVIVVTHRRSGWAPM